MTRHAEWVRITTMAAKRWRSACRRFAEVRNDAHERAIEQRDITFKYERADYRITILGAFFRLLVPLELGDCVPNEVAELLGEEWDLATRHP